MSLIRNVLGLLRRMHHYYIMTAMRDHVFCVWLFYDLYDKISVALLGRLFCWNMVIFHYGMVRPPKLFIAKSLTMFF